MSQQFLELAAAFKEKGIEAETIQDNKGNVRSLRFYLAGKAFVIDPTLDDEERLGLKIEVFEAEEQDSIEDRLDHVLGIIRRTGLDR